jgi:hypothetical protein
VDVHSEGVGELSSSQLGLESCGFVEGRSWGVREQEALEVRERETRSNNGGATIPRSELGSWGVEVGILKCGRAQQGERRG